MDNKISLNRVKIYKMSNIEMTNKRDVFSA